MDLKPLYDVKERLSAAAVAGVGLLGEDFRLRRAAEDLSRLAAVSPVFAKIDSGLQTLLSAPAEQRAGLLLDVLALVDAVVYTQAKTGAEGELEPLPTGTGVYRDISYVQLAPLLNALTASGGGRMELVRSAWENHPEFFSDFRVLPALVAGLGDSYGEIADQNAGILKQIGPAALPLLKQGFDPTGNKEMARRVEVVSALEGKEATPWLREVLPESKKDVRGAVIVALRNDPDNIPLLLDLSKSERGNNRDAVLKALAQLDGEAVRDFWSAELEQDSRSVRFLQDTNTDWAIDLVTTGLQERLERFLTDGKHPTEEGLQDAERWCLAIGRKDSPAMRTFWRWADSRMEEIDRIEDEKGRPAFLGVKLTDSLRNIMCLTGSAPLKELCMELWEKRPTMTRYLYAAFLAALLSCPAAEVYERFSPYIAVKKPIFNADYKKTLNTVLLRALGDVRWEPRQRRYIIDSQPTAEPLDRRWLERLTQAVWKDVPKKGGGGSPFSYYWEDVEEFDLTLMRLADPTDRAARNLLVPYLRKRMEEKGQAYTYSRWLFRLGSSPKGILGKAMAKSKDGGRLRAVWELMSAAAQALPGEEVAQLLEEILACGGFHKTANAMAAQIVPWTAAQLRAGNPFPDWNDWMKLGK